ncbi:MAG TPA: asparagine synthase (glutamine-hydrolyzing) [Vicinamibacterales bacterium]|nr:asparagine synthase (glutamine-hydrolyzing) [Vicinamibacterales bacterium]
MCGLNGLFAYRASAEPPSRPELLSTRDAMRRRGPDGSGEWWSADRRCALAHRRLAILDLSDRALQPMVSTDGHHVVVFNGEIYNYPALRAELEATGVQFRTTSDTEALLHLYARHGRDMVRRLRGMFAFAIWDGLRQGILLARDPYGIKPLFTANAGGTFRFASQVKALLAGGAVSRVSDAAGVVGFHLWGTVPEPFTLYRDIRALPAGQTQWIDGAGAREPEPYASISEVLADGYRERADGQDLEARVRCGVLDSVRAHLLSDVEVGVFLSAGIDSGALLGLVRDAGQSKVRAITLAFDEFQSTSDDEAPLAKRVAEHYGAQTAVRRVGIGEFREDLPAILDAMDQPSIDGVNTWFVSKAAKEQGLKVALSGLGGDELFAGYPSFADLPRWKRRIGPLAVIPGVAPVARAVLQTAAPGYARRRPKSLSVFELAGTWAGVYLLQRGLFLPSELCGILEPEQVREGLERLDPLRRVSMALVPDPGSDTGRVCALESTHYMRNQLLRDADWAGMAHSLEIRVPLADFTLLKSLAPVVPSITRGRGKTALAKAPSRPLLPEAIGRVKTGFRVPILSWIAEAAGRSPAAEPESLGLISRTWARQVMADHHRTASAGR